MERTLISWNIPNIFSVNLMAWAGFLLLVLAFTAFRRKGKSKSNGAPTVAHQTDIVTAADYVGDVTFG